VSRRRTAANRSSHSFAPPHLVDGWQLRPELDALRRSAVDTLERVFPAKKWAWKDPRNCLTLPFWRHLVASPLVVHGRLRLSSAAVVEREP
jgi:hypothetical protein